MPPKLVAEHLARRLRERLLRSYSLELDTLQRLEVASDVERSDMDTLARGCVTRVGELHDHYRNSLSRVSIARSPMSGELCRHSFDAYGLDGPWWRYESNIRPLEDLPPEFLVLTGAVDLAGGVPWTPFVCRPGPSVPFVVPSMLEHDSVRAVICQLSVGRRAAFALSYFAEHFPTGAPLWNSWGSDRYFVRGGGAGEGNWAMRYEGADDIDFDLAPWISEEKLLWIAPGDEAMTLRSGTTGCPFVGLEGARDLVTLDHGRMWT